VLAYVQEQTRQRFDLFSRGRREHLERERTRTPPRAAPGISMLFETSIPGSQHRHAENQTPAADFLSAMNIINSLFQIPTVSIPQNIMEPVIVRPTAEQIQSATALEIVDAEEEICAICQDQMAPGSQALNLNYCDHRFHEPCIRTWFTTNVICPVCRHDIRVPSSSHS